MVPDHTPGRNAESAIGDVAYLARSAHRVEALAALTERPRSRSELCEFTGVSSSTIRRTLSAFDEREWVRKNGYRYEATRLGETVATGMETLLDDTSLYGLVAKRDLNRFFDGLAESPVDSFHEIYEQGAYHEALEHIETIAAAPEDPTTDREYWWRLARQQAFKTAIEYTLAENDLDALAFPDVQVLAPEFEGYHTGELTRADVPTNTFIASQSGCPAISLPAGFTEDGLPVGLELLGAPLSDRRLVGFAAAYEARADPRRPPEAF